MARCAEQGDRGWQKSNDAKATLTGDKEIYSRARVRTKEWIRKAEEEQVEGMHEGNVLRIGKEGRQVQGNSRDYYKLPLRLSTNILQAGPCAREP